MTTQSPGPTLNLSMSRVLAASPEQVFRAFTDPNWYSQWWGPEGTRSEVKQLDLRIGGTYRVDMNMPDGSVAVLYGTYKEIEPPRLLTYSWAWEGQPGETLVTIEIEPHEDGAELTMTHEGFTDPVQVEMHDHGWAGSLNRLESVIGVLTG